MFVVAFILFSFLFLTPGTEGSAHRRSCVDSAQLSCDRTNCIFKNKWCNGQYDCPDYSDENYCNLGGYSPSSRPVRDKNIHFACENGNMFIPIEGYCDGYSSCSDSSDEKDCPCDTVHENEGNLAHSILISSCRTQQKCWKIAVNESQYVDIKIEGRLYSRICVSGNITIHNATTQQQRRLLCYDTPIISEIFHSDVLIRYRSDFCTTSTSSIYDYFNITYEKGDKLCLEPGAFRCSKTSCISPEKESDGNKDCKNGLDEEVYDFGALITEKLKNNKEKAVAWVRSQCNADWGWKGNTHRAVVSLYLAQGSNYNWSNTEDDLIAKQLELELSTYLLRNKDGEASTAELSAYINALLVICHDPRNFYGFDLIKLLKKELEISSGYAPPFPYLTLCNAKEPVSENAVRDLFQIIENKSPNHGFVLELQALAVMALSCIVDNESKYAPLKQNISNALSNLKKEQMKDGSFGNEYTTALVLQAFLAGHQENKTGWRPHSYVHFLNKSQEEDGSFGDFQRTYLMIPILNAKSFVDVGKISCTKNLKRPHDGNMISDIKNKIGKKIAVKLSLYVGDEKDQIHHIVLRTPENITVLELLSLAADIDPKYRFKTHDIKKKTYVYQISNIANDPVSNTFWFIYQGVENDVKLSKEQSPDKIRTHKEDHIIMWYKTLNYI